ncbi:hypothetical protein IJJ08_03735 [bacterium]|nr:hypothetical protein [bacterium]
MSRKNNTSLVLKDVPVIDVIIVKGRVFHWVQNKSDWKVQKPKDHQFIDSLLKMFESGIDKLSDYCRLARSSRLKGFYV